MYIIGIFKNIFCIHNWTTHSKYVNKYKVERPIQEVMRDTTKYSTLFGSYETTNCPTWTRREGRIQTVIDEGIETTEVLICKECGKIKVLDY